jgi:hypothetical protein
MCTAYVLPIIQYVLEFQVCLPKKNTNILMAAGASWLAGVSKKEREGGGGDTCPAKKEIGNQRNNNRLKKRTDSLTPHEVES